MFGMVDYIIRATLAEESNAGWVWICSHSTRCIESRAVVSIRRPGQFFGVYAEVRKIDKNFLSKYNRHPRFNVDCERDILVISEWYRLALAIWGTTKPDNETGTVSLIVKKAKIPVWRSLRAACHHPDPVVRLGARLGVLGVWLGFLSVWLGISGVGAASGVAVQVGFVLLGILGAVGVWATRGPPRPRLS